MIQQPLRIGMMLCLLLSGSLLWAQRPGQDPNMHGPGHSFPGHPPTPEEREAARQRIGITVQQQGQIEQMVTDSEKQRRDLGGQLHALYQQLGETYDSYTFDRVQEKDLRKKITDVHWKLLKVHTETEERLRKILNQDQFAKMRAEMRSHRGDRRSREPGRGEHGPGPGQPGGRPGEPPPG